MSDNVKVIMNYLPQYHTIPENDKWWGKGFTDWTAVKNSKPFYKGHIQPRIPLNNNYYALDDVESIKWQVNLAKKYGVYGFGIYHYWFNSNLNLLGKPAEIILCNPDIKINYMFLWDNMSWRRTWSNVRHATDWAPNFDKSNDKRDGDGILAELIYGNEEDWKFHFDYLLPFFKDNRYIKINNCPLFGFFRPENNFYIIKKMTKYWNKLAIENGFSGVICMSRDNYRHNDLEYKFRYAPLLPNNKYSHFKYKFKDILAKRTNSIRFYNYDKCWKEILREAKTSDSKTFLSGFVRFDDTPRRGKKGRVIIGSTPEKFGKYIKQLLEISQKQGKEYLFITAWNEWGEGAYFEPDTEDGTAYIEELGRALNRK